MTLNVCLRGTDGLVAASDSRGTFGDPRAITAQNDTLKKVYLVENVGILMAGTEQGNMLVEELARIAKVEKISGASAIMAKLRDISRAKFNEWFSAFPMLSIPNQNPQFVRPTLQLTLAGYDVVEGKSTPRFYSMVSNFDFAPNLHDYGFALGGVAQYALYLLNRLYSSDMTVEDLKHLAAYVVTETAAQDGKVGGPVQMAVILPNTGFEVGSEELAKIVVENEHLSKDLKGLFRSAKKA
jgi:20S proteasome alpha/beta subunit